MVELIPTFFFLPSDSSATLPLSQRKMQIKKTTRKKQKCVSIYYYETSDRGEKHINYCLYGEPVKEIIFNFLLSYIFEKDKEFLLKRKNIKVFNGLT